MTDAKSSRIGILVSWIKWRSPRAICCINLGYKEKNYIYPCTNVLMTSLWGLYLIGVEHHGYYASSHTSLD